MLCCINWCHCVSVIALMLVLLIDVFINFFHMTAEVISEAHSNIVEAIVEEVGTTLMRNH